MLFTQLPFQGNLPALKTPASTRRPGVSTSIMTANPTLLNGVGAFSGYCPFYYPTRKHFQTILLTNKKTFIVVQAVLLTNKKTFIAVSFVTLIFLDLNHMVPHWSNYSQIFHGITNIVLLRNYVCAQTRMKNIKLPIMY